MYFDLPFSVLVLIAMSVILIISLAAVYIALIVDVAPAVFYCGCLCLYVSKYMYVLQDAHTYHEVCAYLKVCVCQSVCICLVMHARVSKCVYVYIFHIETCIKVF